jgi:hypothetical protein
MAIIITQGLATFVWTSRAWKYFECGTGRYSYHFLIAQGFRRLHLFHMALQGDTMHGQLFSVVSFEHQYSSLRSNLCHCAQRRLCIPIFLLYLFNFTLFILYLVVLSSPIRHHPQRHLPSLLLISMSQITDDETGNSRRHAVEGSFSYPCPTELSALYVSNITAFGILVRHAAISNRCSFLPRSAQGVPVMPGVACRDCGG